jgi:hypothetical protein
MEAASTSKKLANFYQTIWRNNPEDSHLRTRLRENLKAQKLHSPKNCDSGTDLAMLATEQSIIFLSSQFLPKKSEPEHYHLII